MRLGRWGWLGVLAALVACSGGVDAPPEGDTDVPNATQTVVLTAEGAVVTLGAEAIRDPSVSFVLDPVAPSVALPDGAVALTGVYALHPEDIRFAAPISLSFDASAPGRGQVLRLADAADAWLSHDFIDVGSTASFQALRSGTFVVVQAPAPSDGDADGVGDDEDCDDDDPAVGAPVLATVWVEAGERVQDAITAATGGDVIGVSAGTFDEVLSLLGKSLRLVSRCPQGAVLDGGGRGLPILTYDGGAAGSLEGFVLRNGEATDGGAVFIGSAAPALLGNRFLRNEATRDGGAVFVDDTSGPVRIEGNTFVDNLAGRHGAGLATGGAHDVVVQGNVFSDNVAISSGGAIYLGGRGSRVVQANTISGGAAELGGGLAGVGALSLLENTFSLNRAELRGGAVYLSEATLTMSGGVLEGNVAALLSGGAIALQDVGFSIVGVTLRANQAGTDGGAIDVLGGAGELVDCSLVDNVAASDGGGLSLDVAPVGGEPARVQGCVFEQNHAVERGGAAIDVTDSALGAVSFDGNRYDNNTTDGAGGALYLLGSAATCADEAFEDNNAGADGGAIAGEDWIGALSASSFLRNAATGRGGAIVLLGVSEPRVWGNGFDGNEAYEVSESGGALRVEVGATPRSEDGAPWDRVDRPQCGPEPFNTYATIAPNLPDDVAFADGGACVEP
jgi:predicted outer membrane repeat protein